MFFVRSRVGLAVAAALLLSTQAYAAQNSRMPSEKSKDIQALVQKKSRYTPEEREAERLRRVAVVERSNRVFTLLGGEMALQKGDAGTALATYMVSLDRTKSPEVAERALEMAVSLNAFEQAELIYQKWRQIEPVPGEAQKRMAWLRDLLMGKADQKLSGLNEVLANAKDEQIRRIFLLLAQSAVQQPGLAEKAAPEVHKAAKQYEQMPEAAIADVIFSSAGGKEQHAVGALQRLAALDANILPPTQLTLRLMAQRNPEVLRRFFETTDTKNLSTVWQELEISSLMSAGQQDKAYARLQALLAENPSADLYIQAALLSNMRHEDIGVTDSYLEKAYRYGTGEQKSRAAVIGAMRYADAKDYAQAAAWADKITAPDYVFDKAVLKASIAAQQGKYVAALTFARKAQKLPEQQGRFFGAVELQRVYLYSLAQHAKPQEALAELNALMMKTQKRQDAGEHLPDILYQRAMVYERLQQHEKAIADLRRYQELSPNSATAMNALGYTLLTAPNHSRDFDEAFRLIQTAYQLDPESAAINDSMGWAYYLKGDAQAAQPYLQYAYQQFPDAELAAHLGEVLWQNGDKAQAEKVWREGLQHGGSVDLLKAVMKKYGVSVSAKPQKKR